MENEIKDDGLTVEERVTLNRAHQEGVRQWPVALKAVIEMAKSADRIELTAKWAQILQLGLIAAILVTLIVT